VADPLAPVYRVNWMRARSRLDRWKEELAITNREMVWVLRWFETRRAEWVARAEASVNGGPSGSVSYACRQAAGWKELRDASGDVFHRVNPSLEQVFGYQTYL
jgi:hypothetical protein